MINGIVKLSLTDYPKTPALVIFTGGCNFRCPFCHNKSIVNKTNQNIDTNRSEFRDANYGAKSG